MLREDLYAILAHLKGTTRELDLILVGDSKPVELRNVVSIAEMGPGNLIEVKTRQNNIWIDPTHVAIAYSARADM